MEYGGAWWSIVESISRRKITVRVSLGAACVLRGRHHRPQAPLQAFAVLRAACLVHEPEPEAERKAE